MDSELRIERRVLVCFKKNLPVELVQAYYDGIEELRSKIEDLVHFEMHTFESVKLENALNAAVADVIFPDVMTVWQFENSGSLERFITSEEHIKIAKEKFKPAVEKRIVFNCRLAH